ncbi:uncharacterized protein [Miscanthus floridulus]|uniref:uncharacterized protein n=1 Tax=Miscanthus floridulus TaxID=154761 RepID=UPI0034586ACA
MAEPTLADVMKMLQAITTDMSAMQAEMAALKAKSAPSGDGHAGGHPDGTRDVDLPPKPKRWDFPRFDGTTDPMLFLNKCEAYFRQHRTMVEERVRMASYHLDDVAQLWYDQLMEDEGAPSWANFKDRLSLRFGPPLRSAPLFELTECRRTGTVEEYANRFQALLPRAGRLDEAQRVQLFTAGLLPPLSHAVYIHNPESLAAAMSLARQVELMEAYRLPPPPARAPQRGIIPAAAARPALPAQPPLLALPPSGCPAGPWRGFCKRIFFLEGVEIDDDRGDAVAETGDLEAPVFSLHAVAGVACGGTMQLIVAVGAASLVALLDSDSTHNFISAGAADRTGLRVEPRPRLTAVVANGERVACPGVIRAAPVTIADTSFNIDLFVMPLAGFDVVLGTQWLATLGPVVWDFAAPSMALQLNRRIVH